MSIALVYHINLESTCLPLDRLRDYIGHIGELVDQISVPVNLTAAAQDWLFMHEVRPDILESIKSNDLINILDSTFSHALPSMFQNYRQMMADIGKMAHKDIFGQNSDIFFFPEFDVTCWSPDLLGGYRSTITNHEPGTEYFVDMRKVDIPVECLFFADAEDGSFPMLNFKRQIISGELSTYEHMHLFFQEKMHEKTLVNHLRFIDLGQDTIQTFVWDFEVPYLNMLYSKDGSHTFPRSDLWKRYMDRLSKHPDLFVYLDWKTISPYFKDQDPRYFKGRDLSKWVNKNSEPLIREVSSLLPYDDYSTLLLLNLMGSDCFTIPGREALEQPVKRYESTNDRVVNIDGCTLTISHGNFVEVGKVQIAPDRSRLDRFYDKIKVFKEGQKLGQSDDFYLKNLHNVLERATRYLR
ncbi:MAG: hypothetical protein ABIJ08_06345 [Nanoarchaeota archaeon]